MVAQFGWRHLLAAWSIAAAAGAIAFGVYGLPQLFDFAQADPTSHRLTIPRYDPAGYNPPSNVYEFFYDESEMDERHPGQH